MIEQNAAAKTTTQCREQRVSQNALLVGGGAISRGAIIYHRVAMNDYV
jgi:hypothetical protein